MLLDEGVCTHSAPVPYTGHIVLESSALACYVAQSQGLESGSSPTCRGEALLFSELSPSLDWELVWQAAGGYGERVEDAAEVPAAC